MGKVFPSIDSDLRAWIGAQRVFFVSTAPLAAQGHVNCSPRGGDAFRVLDDHAVAWSDLTGSGAETIAHLRENGRICVMFCAFEGAPRIVRLHGVGTVVEPGDPRFAELEPLFAPHVGRRAFVRVDVTRISDSCGWAVPLYDYRGERDALDRWCETKGPDGLADYRALRNRSSIDGLPALG